MKAKDSEINAVPLCLENANNMKNNGLIRYVHDFSVDYDAFPVDDMLNIHKYLLKKHGIV